jgi:hypothetical protein
MTQIAMFEGAVGQFKSRPAPFRDLLATGRAGPGTSLTSAG